VSLIFNSASFVNIDGFEVLKVMDDLHTGFLHYDAVSCGRCVSLQSDLLNIMAAGSAETMVTPT
jgi:hypothetical protein